MQDLAVDERVRSEGSAHCQEADNQDGYISAERVSVPVESGIQSARLWTSSTPHGPGEPHDICRPNLSIATQVDPDEVHSKTLPLSKLVHQSLFRNRKLYGISPRHMSRHYLSTKLALWKVQDLVFAHWLSLSQGSTSVRGPYTSDLENI